MMMQWQLEREQLEQRLAYCQSVQENLVAIEHCPSLRTLTIY